MDGHKRALKALFGEYQYWKVYAIRLPQPHVRLPVGVSVRRLVRKDFDSVPSDAVYMDDYFGEGAFGLGLFIDGRLAVLQGVWWGERYLRERQGRTWKIPSDAVKTHGLYTMPDHRGNGYAALLKRYTHHHLSEQGFAKVYCRIWHSHKSSIRVSRKAGMKWIGCYIEVCPLGRRIALSVPIPGR